jgi:hypothetical protein
MVLDELLHNVALDLKHYTMTPQPQACHICRRQRLKFDRALPHCLKRIKRGQECLAYQRLFRWEQGVASRGKMNGMTFEEMRARHKISRPQSQQLSREISPLGSLTDPLLQDLSHASRKYLSYCGLESFSLCRRASVRHYASNSERTETWLIQALLCQTTIPLGTQFTAGPFFLYFF